MSRRREEQGPLTPVPVASIEEARTRQAAERGEVKLVEADADEIRKLDGLLAQTLFRLGRARLDVLKAGSPPLAEFGFAIEAVQAENRYTSRIVEIGKANGVPLGVADTPGWTFDFATMRFFRTIAPSRAQGA